MLVARGYSAQEIRRKVIEVLKDSEAGISGAEISRITGISRITMTKYLKIFALEGTLRQREMGNITLWLLEPNQESFSFPDDYFRVASAYMERLEKGSETEISSLICNCMSSGASAIRIILEIVLPASDVIFEMYDNGKIGAAEQKLLHNIISRSLRILECSEAPDPKRNVVVIAADTQSTLAAEAASAAYRASGWSVFELGDMSHAGVLFDLDFQRLTAKIWKSKQGILLVTVFSQTLEGLNFFTDAINPLKKKSRGRMRLVLCSGSIPDDTKEVAADIAVSSVADVLQWSQTVSDAVD